MAYSPQVDGIKLPKLIDLFFGDDFACFQVAIAAVIKLGRFIFEILQGCYGVEHLACFPGHFGSGSITANHSNLSVSAINLSF